MSFSYLIFPIFLSWLILGFSAGGHFSWLFLFQHSPAETPEWLSQDKMGKVMPSCSAMTCLSWISGQLSFCFTHLTGRKAAPRPGLSLIHI